MSEPNTPIVLRLERTETKQLLLKIKDEIVGSGPAGVLARSYIEKLIGGYNGRNFDMPKGFATREDAEVAVGYILGSIRAGFRRQQNNHARVGWGPFTLQNAALKGATEKTELPIEDLQPAVEDILATCRQAEIAPLEKAKEGLSRGQKTTDPRTSLSFKRKDQ